MLDAGLKKDVNYMFDFSFFESATAPAAPADKEYFYYDRLAFTIAAESRDVDVYGVKSNQGTTDGFKVLPLTNCSNDFFLAAWK